MVPKKTHAKPLWEQKVKLSDILSMVGCAGSRGWCITVLYSCTGESKVNGFPLLCVIVFVIPLQTSTYEESTDTFHIPHREVGMFFLHIGEVCVTHTCHSGPSELLSYFSRERRQTFLLPQRSNIASPNLQRSQVSPSLYFRGSVCRLPGFENFSSSLLVVSQNSRVPPPNCWSGAEAVPLHSKKKKKTSRNARFLEWLSSRMRQHSHGRESCTCRLLHSFFFKDGSIVQDLDLESSSFFCNFLSSIFFWRVKTYRYQCSTLWPSLLMIKSLCCGALPLIRLCILEALYKCVYLYYYYYFHNHPLHN